MTILLRILCALCIFYSQSPAAEFTHNHNLDKNGFFAHPKDTVVRPTQFVSFDGGGIRGLYSLKIVEEIESKLSAPITDYCKCFAGTSTGGLIALGYASGKSTADLKDLYAHHGDQIFYRSCGHTIKSLAGLIDEKYETEPLENKIFELFGKDTTLKDLKIADVIIPSTNITSATSKFFNSYKAKLNDQDNYPLWQVARSTSAAPTYFEPLNLDNHAMVDGGLIANNPTLLAGVALEGVFGPGCNKKFHVVSIGTGKYDRGITYDKAKSMGLAEWAYPISFTIMDSSSNMFDQLSMVHYGEDKYIRLNGQLDQDIALDGISPEQIKSIEDAASKYIKDHPQEIDKAVKLLQHSPH